MQSLDASEEDVPSDALDDIDGDALDKRDEGRGEAIQKQMQEKGVASPPVSPDEAKWHSRRATIEPLLNQAITEKRGDTTRMAAVFAFAVEKADNRQLPDGGEDRFEPLNKLLMEGQAAAKARQGHGQSQPQ